MLVGISRQDREFPVGGTAGRVTECDIGRITNDLARSKVDRGPSTHGWGGGLVGGISRQDTAASGTGG